MKITVLNGSPKGMKSVTMQYVKYLENRYKEHSFTYFSVAHRIRAIEKNPEELREITGGIRYSDMVLWAFPLYYMLCCSQYKRFIEIVYGTEHGEAFRGIPAAALTTSINFYDHTALNYIRGICDDMGMPFCGSFSAEMSDLFKEEERKRLRLFFKTASERVSSRDFLARINHFPDQVDLEYFPDCSSEPSAEVEGKWLLITDLKNAGSNLKGMVKKFIHQTGNRAELIDLAEMDFKPCTGCCRCGMDNRCMFGEDEFVTMHRDKFRKADVIVFAGEIHDRYLSSTLKRFFDRSFYMGHVPSIKGKQVGFLISGGFRSLGNVQEILESWVELQRCALVDTVTDEQENSAEIDRAVSSMVLNLERGRKTGYIPPNTFRRAGGAKLFRDAVWGSLRPVFQADHRYYRKNGYYDFPQKRVLKRVTNTFFYHVLRFPLARKQFLKSMPDAMIKRFRKVAGSES